MRIRIEYYDAEPEIIALSAVFSGIQDFETSDNKKNRLAHYLECRPSDIRKAYLV